MGRKRQRKKETCSLSSLESQAQKKRKAHEEVTQENWETEVTHTPEDDDKR